ncbi:MAG: HYExAFE family protein, partial [Thermoguttaceae bacterium]|nr:HYExAFE family protein [Thermoguttaceae bacterium]
MLKNRYETVFERYLRAIKRPFLSNRQERRFDLDNGATLKNFDYLVSDADGVNWIVDVKGRRFPGGLHSTKYWKNWTTEDDLRGLLRWEQILSAGGDEYRDRGAFVFAYLVTGERAPVPEEKIFVDRSERYAFLVVPLKTYIAEAKYISPKWQTYEIPAKRFQELAVPADLFFTAKRDPNPLAPENDQI